MTRTSGPTTTTHTTRRALLAVLLALAFVASACTAGGDDSASTESEASADVATDGGAEAERAVAEGDVDVDSSAATEESATEADSEAAPPALGSGGTGAGALQPVDIGRDIVFTATIEVEVDDVARAGAEALTVVQGLGGLLFGQQTTTDGTPTTTLVFRVVPADFATVVARLGELGVLRNQNISADDVTERVVDLESRIITAEASVERLRGFLAGATNLNDIAALEAELLRRETDLELLRGQLRTVQDQVDLATITMTLTQRQPGPEIELETTFYAGHDGGAACQGSDDVAVDEGDEVTICYVVTNAGDTALTDVEIADPTFDLDADDIVASGDPSALLAPGQRLAFHAEVTAEFSVSSQSRATARPVDATGADLSLGLVTAAGDARLDVTPDDSLPGFLDGLAGGWAVLRQLIAAAVLVAGFLLPFVWLPAVIVVVWRRVLRPRRDARRPPPPAAPSVVPPVVP